MHNQDGSPHFQININGTNRYERALDALLPANVMIDGKEIIDRVFYTLKMSEHYKHFDVGGNNDCMWDSLLIKNIYFQLAHIYKYDFVKQINKNEAGVILSGNINGKGKKELKKYIETLAGCLKGNATECKTTDGIVIRELCAWISGFEQYKDNEFKTFYSHLTVAKKEAHQIYEILEGILMRFTHESTVDIVFEFNDAISKLKRYFYAISNLAKDEFNQQLAADENIDPHISLFFSFLQLFNDQRAQLNSLTASHLDYCYTQLMGLSQSSAVADQVYVSFTVSDKMSPYTVPATTQLDAGKDGNGTPIIFSTDEDIVVNTTTVGNLKALLINHFSAFSNKGTGSESASETFTIATQKIPNFNEEAVKLLIGPNTGNSDTSSSSAGSSSTTTPPSSFTDEDLGLVIASPLLYIEDGHANVTLTINLNLAEDVLYQEYFKQISSQPFSLYVTTASGWFNIASYTFVANDNSIVLSFTDYDAVKSPIVSYDPKIYKEGYNITTPAIKINLHRQQDGDANPYLYMRYLIISKINIQVEVADHKKIKVQNNVGMVNPTNPFQAFGPIPQVGGYFSLKNANIFNRYLTFFKINIEWMPLPSKRYGFNTYYEKYNVYPYNGGLTNDAFQVNIQGLDGNNYEALQIKPTEFQLFYLEQHKLQNQSTLAVNKSAAGKTLGFSNDASLAAEKDQDFSMPGSVRLTLTSPPAGFGFDLYPSVLSNAVTENAKTNLLQWLGNVFNFWKRPAAAEKQPTVSQKPDPPQKLPNQPFIPVIKSLAVGYKLNQSKTLDNAVFNPNDDIAVIHVNPFGYKTIYPSPVQDTCYLVPQFVSGNNLFIGLANLSATDPINLLITLNENVIENNFEAPTPVSWYYLKDNDWSQIEDENINADSTNRFTKNGIVKLNVPGDITVNNTVMPPDLSWILATVAEDDLDNKMIRNLSTIIYSVVNNATSATRQIDNLSGNVSLATLPAGSVKGLVTRVAQITAIAQPLPSFGGLGSEDPDSYYVRVSERLRHKARPLSAWELERIVLDKFTEIRYAKCINFKANSWHMPDIEPQPDMLMIVVGDVYYSATNSIHVPYTTLSNIQTFLEEIINANLNIVVSNPHVERLKFKCDITFKNNDLSKEKNLETDFANYLNPWMDNQNKKVKINTTIYKSDILGYLRNRPYVVDIRNLVIIHIFERGLMTNTGIEPPIPAGQTSSPLRTEYLLEETADDGAIRTFLPYGMFVASPPHLLSPIKRGGGRQPKYMGLGEMIVSDDFRIREEVANGPQSPATQTDISPDNLSFIIDID